MFTKTLKRAGTGFVLGMAMGNLIAALTGPEIVSAALLERAGSLSAALLWQTLLSGLIGAVGMGGTGLYDIESWSLLLADAAHYALILAVFCPVSRFLGWCPTAGALLLTALIMLLAHTLLFLTLCAYYRAQVRELNRLNELRKQRAKEQHLGGAL